MRSIGDSKREFMQEKYKRVRTILRSAKVMSESKMAELLDVDRNLVSCFICKDRITKALKEDERYKDMLKIANKLPITLYNGLNPLKYKEPKQIREFFHYYGSIIGELNATDKTNKALKEMCRTYLKKGVVSYGEFSKVSVKESRENKVLSQIIKELEKENEALKDEIRLYRDMLALRDSDPDFFKGLMQQRLDMGKK